LHAMGEVNFYLKKPELSTGKSLIVLYKSYHGKRLVFSTGESILPNTWNPKKQRLKNNSATTKDGHQYLNDFLTGLANECDQVYAKALVNGIPAPERLRQALHNFMNPLIEGGKDEKTPTLFKLIERFINNEIKHKGRDKSLNTIKTYTTCKKHLQEFEKLQKTKLDFASITLDFYYQYVSFLKKKGLGQNAISKDIAIIKVFMGEAIDLGYTTNLQYLNKKFAVSRIETDAVYLKERELVDLYRFDFSKNKRLENIRDLFVFGCFSGLRFSDYSTVKAENIVKDGSDYFIKMITKKTNSLVIIPCNPIVMELFKKYDSSPNKLPKTVSNQTFNEYIKEACRVAGLTEKGRLSSKLDIELCDCISSHTARRSFATNLYLEGFPTLDIMKITGHSTEKAFMKYIRFNKLDAAKRLNEHTKKGWSEKMLRVAS
jgi:integrase